MSTLTWIAFIYNNLGATPPDNGIDVIAIQVRKKNNESNYILFKKAAEIIDLKYQRNFFATGTAYIFSSGPTIYEALSQNSLRDPLNISDEWCKLQAESMRLMRSSGTLESGGKLIIPFVDDFSSMLVGRVYMPDGTDGLFCLTCKEYFPYVEQNVPEGFLCRKHKNR